MELDQPEKDAVELALAITKFLQNHDINGVMSSVIIKEVFCRIFMEEVNKGLKPIKIGSFCNLFYEIARMHIHNEERNVL